MTNKMMDKMTDPKTQKTRGQGNGGFIQIALMIIGALVILKYAYQIDVIESLTRGWERHGGVVVQAWEYLVSLFHKLVAKFR